MSKKYEMCTEIYKIQNISLWSCPPTQKCMSHTLIEENKTLNNSYRLQSTFMNITYIIPYNITLNDTNYTNHLNIPYNITLNDTNYTNHLNITYIIPYNITLNDTNYTNHLNIPYNITLNDTTSNVPSPSMYYLSPGTMIISPSPMLRRTPSPNKTASREYPADIPKITMEDRSWVHIFWITPLFFLIMFILKYRGRIVQSKIRSIFVPKERYITRSQSWPQISQTSGTRTHSEPVFSQVTL